MVRKTLIEAELTLSTTKRGVPSREEQQVQRLLLLLQLGTDALNFGQQRDIAYSPDEVHVGVLGPETVERLVDTRGRLLPANDVDTCRPFALANQGEFLERRLADARRPSDKDGGSGVRLGVDAGVGCLHLLAGHGRLNWHGEMVEIELGWSNGVKRVRQTSGNTYSPVEIIVFQHIVAT